MYGHVRQKKRMPSSRCDGGNFLVRKRCAGAVDCGEAGPNNYWASSAVGRCQCWLVGVRAHLEGEHVTACGTEVHEAARARVVRPPAEEGGCSRMALQAVMD
eukprot:scaffold104897_cov72-Phaeocystis_antarctica.AAC.5